MKRISLSHPCAVTMVASGGILVANVLTGVLTARLLGANGRGQLASITTWAVMISWICTFGFGDALVYFQAKNQHDSGRVLGTALLVGGVLSIFGIVAAQALLSFGFRAQSAATLHLARLSMLWIPACVGMAFSVDLIAGHQRFFALNAARLVQPLSFAFGIVFLSAARQFGVPLVLAVFFSSYLVVFLGSLLFLLRESGLGRPSVDLTRRGMSYGLRLQGQALGTI